MNLDIGAKCALSTSSDDIKLEGVVDIPESDAAIQRDWESLERWADRILMQFKKGKCKVMHLRENNPRHHCMLGEPLSWKAAL